jgi:hypothetical protein
MAQDYAASVQGVAIRVTRLLASGDLIPTESYTSKSFIRVSFTPEYEEGDEITEKNADGTICVTFKAPDTLKRVTMEIAVCDPDPVISQLLSGGVLLVGDVGTPAVTEPLGWASAQVGEDVSGNGVAVEVWSRAIVNGKPAHPNPYFHWIFPYTKTRLSGDRVIENGLLANTFDGYGLGNDQFGEGPDNTTDETATTKWPWPEVTGRPYMYGRVPNMPNVARGLWDWSAATGGPTSVDPAEGDTPGIGDNISDSSDQPPTTP